jgi:hypothetical protein
VGGPGKMLLKRPVDNSLRLNQPLLVVRRNHRITFSGGACDNARCGRGSRLGEYRRLRATGNGGGGSQQPTKACVAGADHFGDRRGLRHRRDHAAGPGSRNRAWRWQKRFMREGVSGLLHNKTRKPGLPPFPSALVERVVEPTLAEPPARRPTTRGGQWRRQAASRCARCSASGRRSVSSRIGAAFQTVAGSGVCRQAARCGRALSRPARPQTCAVGGREVANPVA